MTWAKFEDRFPWHRKVRGLSDTSFRLHVSAVCWSCEHLTDGKVPTDDLPLVSDVRRPERAVAELVRRGLWDVVEDGWAIHDFLEFNESRETVLARRAADAERKRRGRENRKPAGSPPGVQPDSHPDSTGESVRTEPARPEPKEKTPSRPAVADLPVGFAEFWQAYPRKVEKQAAIKAYGKALKVTTPDRLLHGARQYARQVAGSDPSYTKHPTTWLNSGCWDDEPAPLRLLDSPTDDSFGEERWMLRGSHRDPA